MATQNEPEPQQSTIHIDVVLNGDDLKTLVDALAVALHQAKQEQDEAMIAKLTVVIQKIGKPIMALHVPGREKGKDKQE